MGNIRQSRILAVVIQSGRFGFAAFETPDHLLDRGMARFDSPAKARRWFIRSLRTFRPSLVVLHRRGYRDPRSGQIAKATMRMARRQAKRASVPTTVISGRRLHEYWRREGKRNKYAVAALIASRFPELAPAVPVGRKCYEREPWLMMRFDAVALGAAYLAQHKRDSGELFRRTSR
jgi:hypothetical protein